MGPWDPGPKLCRECWDLPSQDLNDVSDTETHQMVRGPKYLDVNTMMNVHVSTKLTVGILEHSFKSIDKSRSIN